jgi:hypothetical protein
MRRLCVLLCALFVALAVGAGCASDPADGEGPLAPALKDLRGDNMQMRGFGSQSPQPIKPVF